MNAMSRSLEISALLPSLFFLSPVATSQVEMDPITPAILLTNHQLNRIENVSNDLGSVNPKQLW